MKNENAANILNELNEVLNGAWAETIADLTPEELEMAKKITPAQWVNAIVEVGLELGAYLARMIKRN